jgi:hypothetical protein
MTSSFASQCGDNSVRRVTNRPETPETIGFPGYALPMVAKHLLLCVFVTGAMFVLPTTVSAEDSMRCGSRLVTRGDGKDKVRKLCGEPTDVSLRGYVRRTPVYEYGYGYNRYEYYGPGWVDMPVEIWTYNLGSHKLLRKLRFVGDELEEIETDGYGY